MKWIKEDFESDSKHLVVALGSFYEGTDKKYNPNQFEWDKRMTIISQKEPFNKLYVKDAEISWWHGRFEGIDPGILNVASVIKQKAEKSKAEKVLVIGPSLGGYGALMFTCLCHFDVAIAISPQTKLTNFRYKKNRLAEKYEGLGVKKEETDVKYMIENYGVPKSRYFIYYGDKHSGDVKAANRLAHFPNVYLKPIDSDKHTVASIMRDTGITEEIILRFVRNELQR